jgi:hypothetical protein
MGIVGHSQLAITTDLDSHVMPTALREAADDMDRILHPAVLNRVAVNVDASIQPSTHLIVRHHY